MASNCWLVCWLFFKKLPLSLLNTDKLVLPFSTIHLKFPFYFNTFQTDFFWSIAEIREKTISEDFEVAVLVTLSKIKTTTESVPYQRPFISFASLLPATISFVAPFRWICAITLTADKNSECLWQANQRFSLNEQLVAYTPSLQISASTLIDLSNF